jgi:hypothetical protein
MREESALYNFTDEEGMIAWRMVFADQALHIAEALFQDRAARFAPYPLYGGELCLRIRAFESTQKIFLVSGEKMQGKTSTFLNQLMGIPVRMHGHQEERGLIGNLRNPGGDHSVDLLSVVGSQHVYSICHAPKGL